MDITDKKILKILSRNANASATEIGASVHLSVPAVNKRILRMQNEGLIKHFTIMTDPKKMSKTITAFVFIVMKYGDSIKSLLEYAETEPDVLECYSITGEYDYMLKKRLYQDVLCIEI